MERFLVISTSKTARQIGTDNVSYAQEIAEIQRLLQKCNLKHQMTCTGTAVGMLSMPISASTTLSRSEWELTDNLLQRDPGIKSFR